MAGRAPPPHGPRPTKHLPAIFRLLKIPITRCDYGNCTLDGLWHIIASALPVSG